MRSITGRPIFFDMCAGIAIDGIRRALRAEAAAAGLGDVDELVGRDADASSPSPARRSSGSASSRRRSTCRSPNTPSPSAAPSSDATCRPSRTSRRARARLSRTPRRRRRTTTRRAARPSAAGLPAARAKSPAVHFDLLRTAAGRSSGCRRRCRRCARRGRPGTGSASGSTVNGSSSKSTLIRSIASCAIASVSAATARIGWPIHIGSLVRIGSAGAGSCGTSAAVRMPSTPGQRERRARVDVADARVRHRAQQELAEHHAFGAEVLRVLGLAGHLAVHVGRHEVLSQQVVSHRARLLDKLPQPNLVVRRLVDFKPKRHAPATRPTTNQRRFPPQQRFFEEISAWLERRTPGARLVLVDFDDGIAWVTLNRPDKRNAMSPDAQRGDARTVEALATDDALRRVRAHGRRRLVRGRHGSQGVLPRDRRRSPTR